MVGERPSHTTLRVVESDAVAEPIVEAASELLATEGLVGVTTKRIAARAGVDVDVVYRCFTDKQAVVAEVAHRLRQRNVARLMTTLERGGGFESVVREVIEGFVLLDDDRDLALRRVLYLEVPASWVRPAAVRVWSEAEVAVATFLRAHVPGLGAEEAERRAFLATRAVEGVVRDSVILLDDDALGAVIDELTAMLSHYLLAAPA